MTPAFTRRRLVLAATAAGALAGCTSLLAPRRIDVPIERLEAALAERFPIVRRLADGIDLTIAVPRLTLQPEVNRVVVECEASGGQRLFGRPLVGVVAVSHGLAYDDASHSIRPVDVRVERTRFDGLPAALERTVDRLARPLVEAWLGRQPLYVLSARDLDRLAAARAVPGPIDVTAAGLSIALLPR
jgi:hypothetical protein